MKATEKSVSTSLDSLWIHFIESIDYEKDLESNFFNHLDKLQIEEEDTYKRFCQEAIGICQERQSPKLELQLSGHLSNFYLQQDSLLSALKYSKRILQLTPLEDFENHAVTYNKMGIIHGSLGNSKEAIDYYLKSVEAYAAQSTTQQLQTYPLGNIANLYFESGNLERARYYNLKALNYSLQLEETERSYNLFYDYYRLGNIFKEQNQLDSTKYYYNKSIEQAKINKDNDLIATTHSMYANFYLEQEQIEIASQYIDSCFQIFDKIKETATRNNIYLTDAKIKLKQGFFQQAEQAAKKLEINENNGFLLQVFPFWKEYNIATENYTRAFEIQEEFYQLQERINSEERTKHLDFLEAKFKAEEKENQIEFLELEKKSQKNLFSILFAAALLLLFFTIISVRLLIVRNRTANQLKHKNQKLIEAENQLKLKNQELKKYIDYSLQLENFAHLASHDLREPLINIQAISHLMEMEEEGKLSESATTYLGYIQDSSKRMEQLLNELLEYSTIGKYSTPVEVDCNQLLNNTLRDLSVKIQNHDAKIICPPLPTICGYQRELQSLFQNLISNALKYRQKHLPPMIEIDVKEKSHHWLFSFKDNGIGIASKHYEKIFLIYKRLNAQSQEEKSTGIGLAYCKKVIELHEGKIWVSSEPKKGSTFFFTINKKLAKTSNVSSASPKEYETA